MASRSPTSDEIAMNAYIHGYAGHSLVTPHTALKQLWWTEERIEDKVTKRFVLSKLRGAERDFLRRPLAFGEGLTDDTYLDWILTRSKRLFLILAEIGCSDQIFGCIDDSWCDEDLPIAWEDVAGLELAYDNDPALNKRFYKTQFTFLLRTLESGSHIEYGPQEHIPMEFLNTLPPASSLQSWDRIHFPGEPEKVFCRRKYALEDGAQETFIRDMQSAQLLAHKHIAPVWATYASDGTAYSVSNFVPEHTLQSYVDHRTPAQLMRVPAERRPVLLCEWMHCLADAVAFLHHKGTAHGAIKPSNIIIDQNNKIAFSDVGTLHTFQQTKKMVKNETHDYAAPESQKSKASHVPTLSKGGMFRLSRLRKLSISTSSSASSEAGYDSGYVSSSDTRPSSISLSHSSYKEDDLAMFAGALDSWSLTAASTPSSESPPSITSSPAIIPRSSPLDPTTLRDLPVAEPEMTDIFSLGCIFLDIVTFIMRGKLTDFVKFRTCKIVSPEGKSTVDASFVANSGKVEEWMDLLEEESMQYGESIYRGIPEILALIRLMLRQNASTRPTASQVRDQVCDVLALTCGVESLCCADNVWPLAELPAGRHSPTATHPALR
ncbi:hypothetical protein AMS68_002824 [Peltaster fructicola]|uniref:Protein kinase domain-containing protein n=1 Tax=Peltaster fructicola TaxID=286661 RepID=A0A6H0XRC3_9PEZI|nr:hypothetical protein AMS68_002824 [Peltaster fructicola]